MKQPLTLLTALLLAPLGALYAADVSGPNSKSKPNMVLIGSPARETSAVLEARSPIEQPYGYVSQGSLSGSEIPESPDPLVAYRWKEPRPSDDLQIYVLSPSAVSADREESFENLQSLTEKEPKVIVKGAGAIWVDFGVESAAWVEFDSPDCPGHVEMSISEYNEPFKTRAPVKHGNTWRLELNRELYEGVRFAWIHVKSVDKPWHITGIRAVCQVKPTNYAGSFSCSDPVLTKAWYMAAYSVKASLCKDYFGAILMDRGDRMSWTGDAHPIQAAALVAFANDDFIRKNIENTSRKDNGIRSYALYWVLSLLDYYRYTGDAAALKNYMENACAKLDSAYAVFDQNPPLRFYGWDERLCAGFELWFKPAPEAQLAYKMLSIRAWSDFAKVMGASGHTDLRDKYNGYAKEKMAELRKSDSWTSTLGLHSAADAINTSHLTKAEQEALFEKFFRNRVNRLSFSPFNQYFIIQAMARMGKHDDALSSVRDMWGGMLQNGATTPYEVFHPSWNGFLGPNDRVPNSQSGVTSLCHPWGAGVVKWLNEEVLGIVPTQPGFTTYDILPHPGRTLTRVSGETPTPLGTIRANFDFASGRCRVSAPQGCIGRVGIPKLEKTIAKITINGTLAWDGSPHAVPGIGGVFEDAEFVVFTGVQPGTYDFVVDTRGTTPAYNEPAVEYAAESLKPDTTTSGNWGGVYGKEGHVLCNYHGEGSDEKQLPAYVKSLDYFRAFPKTKNCVPDPVVWANDTSDKRALARNPSNDPGRNATGYSNTKETMTVTIGIDGPRDYQIALYFVDWKKQGARQVVEMMDADSLNQIAPVRMVSDHSDGIYLIYKVDRSVKFRINNVRGDVSSLSGIFFDQASHVTMSKDSTIKQQSVSVNLKQNDDKKWGLSIEKDGVAFFAKKEPVNIEICKDGSVIETLNAGYDRFTEKDGGYLAEATVAYRDVSFLVTDKWSVANDVFRVDRTLVVRGSMSGGFMSGIQLSYHEPATRDSVKLFAPGMIYGTTDHLTAAAIGGKQCKDFIRIREDRLPAPLFGAYFENGDSLCVLNSKPDGRTTKEDSRDLEAKTIIDERLRFGAIGADFNQAKPEFGYWFPGTEGGITYKGMTYPYGQRKKWSRRYHPIRDGLKQEYQVSFRSSKNDLFADFYTGAWKWAWTTLQPPINFQDIGLVRRSVVNMVGDNVETHHGITGMRKWKYAMKGTPDTGATKTVMGFGGSTVEAACYLLADSLVANNPRATKHRQLGEAVINTYLNLKLSPPAGEGFTFEGKPVTSEPSKDPLVYLRSFSDALKELLKATKREKKAGIEHDDWIVWARTFADWLLSQQQKEGGFPRTWKQGTGVVGDPSPESSYMAIPFLVLLSEITADKRYLKSAIQAADFCWNSTQKDGVFVGATIDNPNVIDKEAGTISLEAYLMLYKHTSDKKWLTRAVVAANFAETWIYLWNVPMPEDEEQKDLHWQKGLSTVGIQLISTGHSLTDRYMAFDTDEFVELYLKTHDSHYYDVALLLLHNTKAMVTLPGRDFGLKGPGWMQEHFSMGPVRGVGLNRNWNPWLASSQLNGMLELEELDKDLYLKMTDKNRLPTPERSLERK